MTGVGWLGAIGRIRVPGIVCGVFWCVSLATLTIASTVTSLAQTTAPLAAPSPDAAEKPVAEKLAAEKSAAGKPAASLEGTGCELTARPTLAIKACTDVLAKEPQNADALAQRGSAHRHMGDVGAAFADFNAALAIDANDAFALSRRASLQINSRNEVAIQADIDRLNAVAPRTAMDYDARGIVRAARRDFAAAIAEYTTGLGIEPSNASLLVNRASAYLQKPDVPAAMADYEKVAAAHPNYAFGHFVRGVANPTLSNSPRRSEPWRRPSASTRSDRPTIWSGAGRISV